MQSLVVFLALAVAAQGSLLPWAQPAHHPAIVLDPHGRPLDTAEVIGARALHLQAKALEHNGHLGHAVVAPIAHAGIAHAAIAPALIAAPAAVSHQSRVDVRHSPAIVTAHAAPVIAAAPVWGAHAGLASPLLGHSGLIGHGHGHLLKKRSLGHWGAVSYSAPIIAPSAVSHQSRVDVVSSPAIVSHAVAAPVYSHAVAAPVVAHAIAPAAVSHQSRVDVRSSPAIVAHSVVGAPLLHAAPLAHGLHGVHGLHGAHGIHGW